MNNKENTMQRELFGKNQAGIDVYMYTLENKNGLKAKIMDYGANLVSLIVPDKNGKMEDIVLGYDKIESYYENGDFFGCTVGPCANRTKDATYTINGVAYQMDQNDNQNNLHSHKKLGLHKKMWQTEQTEDSLIFTVEVKDGEIGFPGNRKITVTYTLTDENELKIHYEGISDKETIFNMTNHSYFNLAGHKNGTIQNHLLKLYANAYTPIAEGSIPTGEVALVKDTPMDFEVEKTIGRDINETFAQLQIANGYDHNYVVDNYDGTIRKIAVLKEKNSGRIMETYTDLPGVQIYTGNYIDNQKGKEGITYHMRDGICFETQFHPNSANEEKFPDIVFGPKRKYETTTIYVFKTSNN